MAKKILSLLVQNARVSVKEIASEVMLTAPAVSERIKKMETAGIIESYTITLNQKILGNDLIAMMDVSLEHPKYYDSFVEMIKESEHIQSCYYLTGKHDFLLKILTDSSDSLERIHREIKSMEGVGATETHFVLKSVKNEIASIPNSDDIIQVK